MEKTLQQLGELMLGAVPTIILFTITYIAYTLIVHKPLVRTLAERRARTQGAVEKAQQDIAAAEQKTAQYEAQLREARMTVYKDQEARRKQWNEQRDSLVRLARGEADTRIKAARKSIEADVEVAKSDIQTSSESLAQEVVRTVLKPEPVGAR
jgi:F-type H+-transporting ATPase subunit b